MSSLIWEQFSLFFTTVLGSVWGREGNKISFLGNMVTPPSGIMEIHVTLNKILPGTVQRPFEIYSILRYRRNCFRMLSIIIFNQWIYITGEKKISSFYFLFLEFVSHWLIIFCTLDHLGWEINERAHFNIFGFFLSSLKW